MAALLADAFSGLPVEKWVLLKNLTIGCQNDIATMVSESELKKGIDPSFKLPVVQMVRSKGRAFGQTCKDISPGATPSFCLTAVCASLGMRIAVSLGNLKSWVGRAQ